MALDSNPQVAKQQCGNMMHDATLNYNMECYSAPTSTGAVLNHIWQIRLQSFSEHPRQLVDA
jgi:hypothetical protein